MVVAWAIVTLSVCQQGSYLEEVAVQVRAALVAVVVWRIVWCDGSPLGVSIGPSGFHG